MHDDGEIDVRACYTAISVSWYLSLYLPCACVCECDFTLYITIPNSSYVNGHFILLDVA